MTVGDTSKVMEIITVAYPRFYNNADKDKALKLWAAMFSDTDTKDVLTAVKAFIATDTSGFPPTIGQIRAQIVRLAELSEPSEWEAWQHIRAAISRENGYGFDRLTELEKAVVGSPYQLRAWAYTDTTELETVVASNVQKAYRSMINRKKELALLPESVKKACIQSAEGLAIGTTGNLSITD